MEKKIVQKAIEILKNTENGSLVRIPELIKKTNLCDESFMEDSMGMMGITNKIIDAAKKEKIYLKAVNEEALVGLPSDITYEVKRK